LKNSEVEDAIITYIRAHPGCTHAALKREIKAHRNKVWSITKALLARGAITNQGDAKAARLAVSGVALEPLPNVAAAPMSRYRISGTIDGKAVELVLEPYVATPSPVASPKTMPPLRSGFIKQWKLVNKATREIQWLDEYPRGYNPQEFELWNAKA
jgi:hypothetical protein